MLVEVDTSLRGVCELLAALCRLNLLDARRDERIAAELVRRCTAAPGEGFRYRLDRGSDVWSTFAVLLQRTAPGKPVISDCEDQTAAYGAAILLLEPRAEVEAAITQPRPGQMAHAYLFVQGEVWDPSVHNGMKAPPDHFYSSGETVRVPVATR
ncbi:hypothetical protein [Sorangium sp. So ce131]|uniref:hypothetical protein n=1 Tax=Sorangium sp. So ce131 TaxID=3133282 RepID=UPI003F5DDD30